MSTTTTTTETERDRLTMGSWGRSALVVGVLAAVQAVVGYVLLAWVWPGDLAAIAVLTILQYALPLAGIVLGHVARRREGPAVLSTTGLVLSYLSLAAAVVPVLVELVGLLISPA